MDSTTLRAFLQVLLPEEFEWSPYEWRSHVSKPLGETVQRTLEELESLSGQLELELGSFGVCHPDIEIVQIPEDEKREWSEHGDQAPVNRDGREYRILRISAEAPLPDKTDYWNVIAAREGFEKWIYDIIVAANIAKPGTLEMGKGSLFQNGYEHAIDEMGKAFLLRGARDLATFAGWPKIQALDIAKVWKWLAKQEGFMEGFGGGPTGRAVNAFSRLFGIQAQDDVTNLLWALVGIEALYTEGQGSLMQQVKEKSQVLLGKQEEHRKKLSRMYDFRSRFVHGDLDFSGKRAAFGNKDTSRHNKELLETICFAEAILVASLQKLVELDWAGPSFSYQVTDSSGKAIKN